MNRRSWFAAAVVLTLLCLAISQLWFWRRGLYSDDYALRTRVVDPVTGATTPLLGRYNEMYPARILMHQVAFAFLWLMPGGELLVRTVIALFVALNSALLGLLVHRALGSRTAALIAAWIFLMPVFAAEAVLWTTAAAEYVLGGTLALLYALVVVDDAARDQQPLRTAALAAALLILTLMFAEAYIVIVVLAPLVAAVAAVRAGRSIQDGCRRALRASRVAIPVVVVFSVAFALSPLPGLRGGLDLTITGLVTRAGAYVDRLYWLTLSPAFGRPVLTESFRQGMEALTTTSAFLLAAVAAASLIALSLVQWRSEARDTASGSASGAALLAIGLLWVAAAVFVPGIVAKGQTLDYRLLYFPTAGLGVSIASLCWLWEKRWATHPVMGRLPLLCGILALVAGAIALAGYGRMYQLRSQQDQQQVEAVVRAIPSSFLPQGAVVVPYRFDPEPSGAASKMLTGVFEAWWSTEEALNAAYRRHDLRAIAGNRWGGWDSAFTLRNGPGGLTIDVQDDRVPLDRLVLLANSNGAVSVIRRLVVHACGGQVSDVTLPAAERGSGPRLRFVESLEVSATIEPCPASGSRS
jgi:Ca2+/Na+ antiporter